MSAQPLHAIVTYLNGYSGTTVEVNSSTETAYQLDTSNSDLINGVAPSSFTTGTGSGKWNITNGATVPELNDGIHGVTYASAGNSVQGAWPNPLATVTYTLGLGANNLGYNITSIQSIAAWVNVGYGNQAWTLAIQPAGGGPFVDVATVNYQPLATIGATKVNLTNLNITGIQALRVTTISVNGGNNGGSFVWRELDVVGSSTAPDSTPPTLNTLTSVVPADNATGVAISSNFVATFSEPIALIGSGGITLKNLSGGSDIPVMLPGEVSIAGAVLTINPAANLVNGQEYAVEISANTIKDLATIPNLYIGLLSTDVPNWSFTAVPPDTTPPTLNTLTSLVPADNATGVAVASNLVATFSEPIALTGSGSITVKNLSGGADIPISLPGQVSISGSVLTINPSSNLVGGQEYAVEISSGAIRDLAISPNAYAGLLATDIPNWSFTASTELITGVSSTTQYAFTGDVSATDLLHGLTPVTTGWNTTNQASPLELTDGIHGGAFQALPGDWVQGAWTTVGATAIYNLGLSPSGAGYDITSVQSIADWVSVGFGNQAWTIEVKPVGGNYSTLATVNYQPLGSGGGGSTKVTLALPSGKLASGIEFIKVTANQVNGGANAGAFVWRELDVFGVDTNDATAPTISSLSPGDGTINASLSGNLVATFSENIALGTGNITIMNLDTPAQTTVITLPDARVSVSGAVLTINPDANLVAGTNYAVQIAATAIDDLSGNSFAGIADNTTWKFTTGIPDLAAPTVVTLSPADNAANVPIAGNLVATFNENIALGSGTITIKDLDTGSQTVITLPDARVTVLGAVLTINPSSNFSTSTNFAVRIGAGAITDLSGNPFAGIANDTTWNFSSASTPLRIMCLGDSITAGYTDNPGWVNHPFEFGYRSGLYTILTNARYNFLFVGGSTEPWTGISGDPTQGNTYTPPLDLRNLGQDGHRGYGGTTASGLQSNIVSWLNSDNPDIILLKIGTNSQSTSNLDTLVNTITTTKPNARLIIAQIMPKYTYQAGIVTYNDYIRNTLVPAKQALGKKVTLVDQYAPFLTNPADLTSIDQSLFANGINHPNNDGYDKMAQVWFVGIDGLGIGPNSFDTWITDPLFGIASGQQGLHQDPEGDGIDNGVENFFGTNPNTISQGLVSGAVNKVARTYTFTHPQNATPATDLSAAYRWSKDLQSFQADGAAHGGTTVTFSASVNTPTPGTTTVTATVNGTAIDKLFVDVVVNRN